MVILDGCGPSVCYIKRSKSRQMKDIWQISAATFQAP